MKGLIAVAVVVLALLVWRQPQISHSDNQTLAGETLQSESALNQTLLAPAAADVDGDGVVSILDLAYVSQFFLRDAEPCARATIVRYQTPVTAYENGTPYLVSGRAWPTDHLDAILAGTPIPFCP